MGHSALNVLILFFFSFFYEKYNNHMINLIRCILLFTIFYCFIYHQITLFPFCFFGRPTKREREWGWPVVDYLCDLSHFTWLGLAQLKENET